MPCVGEPFAPEVVRAMLCIRVNTAAARHSGIRVQTLQALAAMLNAASCRWCRSWAGGRISGDLAPLSHLAIVLIGGGEAFHGGERMPGGEALRRAGLTPALSSFKEGWGRHPQMLGQQTAPGRPARDRRSGLR